VKKLTILKEGSHTKLFLDGIEITDVNDYKIKSSTNGTAELELKIMVHFPVE